MIYINFWIYWYRSLFYIFIYEILSNMQSRAFTLYNILLNILMFFINDIFFLIPKIYLFAITCFFLIFSIYITKISEKNLIRANSFFFNLIIFFVFILTYNTPIIEFCVLNNQLINCNFTHIVELFFLIFLSIYIVVSTYYFLIERIYYVEYFFLLSFITIALLCLLNSNDFLFFYILIELQSLILYTLATLKRFNNFSTEAGLKYFILGALSSGLFLFGVSVLYGFTGLTNFFDLKIFFSKFIFHEISSNISFIVFLLINSIFLFKIAAVPFHIWTPDVYEGIPYPIVLFFGSLPKLILILILIRILLIFFFELYYFWHLILFFSGFGSVVFGTIAGLNQSNIRRLYAYSAIVNVGYFLLILSFLTFDAIETVINYLIIYFISTLSLFAVLLNIRRRLLNIEIKNLTDFISIYKFNPLLAIIFGLIFFSMAGIPPLGGFFAKFFLFNAFFIISELNSFFVLILLFSVITAVYYIRCVHLTFFNSANKPIFFHEINYLPGIIISFLIVFIFFFLIFEPLIFITLNNLILTLFL